jgi:predicted ArsR family transcriptional regulator
MMVKLKKAISFFIGAQGKIMSSDKSNKLLYMLKSRGPLSANALANALGITEVGVRQHLAKLHGESLVGFEDQAGEVGRPKRMWRLTAKGHARFPDTHGDLTVNLIEGIRSVFGQTGLDRLIEARQEAMVATYRQALEPHPDLADRVGVLAKLRTVEGYMAELEVQADGSVLLTENHCPICAAAKTCQGFCRSELVSGSVRRRRFSNAPGASSLRGTALRVPYRAPELQRRASRRSRPKLSTHIAVMSRWNVFWTLAKGPRQGPSFNE